MIKLLRTRGYSEGKKQRRQKERHKKTKGKKQKRQKRTGFNKTVDDNWNYINIFGYRSRHLNNKTKEISTSEKFWRIKLSIQLTVIYGNDITESKRPNCLSSSSFKFIISMYQRRYLRAITMKIFSDMKRGSSGPITLHILHFVFLVILSRIPTAIS